MYAGTPKEEEFRAELLKCIPETLITRHILAMLLKMILNIKSEVIKLIILQRTQGSC
jgi:hypothetical protein